MQTLMKYYAAVEQQTLKPNTLLNPKLQSSTAPDGFARSPWPAFLALERRFLRPAWTASSGLGFGFEGKSVPSSATLQNETRIILLGCRIEGAGFRTSHKGLQSTAIFQDFGHRGRAVRVSGVGFKVKGLRFTI